MSAALAKSFARISSWLRAVTKRGRLDQEMEEEMRFHLEQRAADLAHEGLTTQQALRQARIEFGQIATHKDAMRRSLGLRWWDELGGDILYGARILRKSPGFTAIAVLSLGLAIGANTTIFSVANELLYARLGVPHPEQLRLLTISGDQHLVVHHSWGEYNLRPDGGIRLDSLTYPIYQQLQRDNKVIGDIFAFKDSIQTNITVDGSAQAAQLELVSGNFYEQIGVRPVLGRAILASDDDTPERGTVATISDGFWQRTFNRSPQVIGKVVTVNNTLVTIIGVNPPGFTGAKSVQSSPDIFMPLSMIPLMKSAPARQGSFLTSSDLWWVQTMARIKPGISEEQARASLQVALVAAVRNTIAVKQGETMPNLALEDGSRGLNTVGKQFAKPLYVLLTLVGFVLMLACANVANLMLARASTRQREMGVRLALGAGRWRILRQVLTESLMLSALGGVTGLLLGYLGRNTLPKLMMDPWERTGFNIQFDWRVFAFTAAVTMGTGLIFGLAPAWIATRSSVGTALKDGARSATRQRKGLSGRAIVAFQIALSTLLVAGAMLFLRTLIKLNSIDPGFRADQLILFDISPPSLKYPAPKDVALHARIEEALHAVPGVEGVTLSDTPLVANSTSSSSFHVEGAPPVKNERDDNDNDAMEALVGQDFLKVMEIALISGSTFTDQDASVPGRKAIVNQALAKKFFPNQNPIGKRFNENGTNPAPGEGWTTIIGVCADTRYANLKNEAPPIHFDLYRRLTEIGGVTYIIRTRSEPEAIVPSLRAVVQQIDKDLPITNVRTQVQQINATMRQERMFATLTTGFGVLALALACIGIYGVMAYTVSQRTNEIGIRLALGAQRTKVRLMVIRESGWLALLGVAAGLCVALALGRFVKSMLYGMQATDPLSLIAAAVLLLAVAMAAGWIPAARASRVEPMEALRHE